jgi:glucose-1-phosphate thymidylyltransferase
MAFSVIIPAAGEATRLRPLTTSISKAMVPVNGKPCIDFILERLLREPQVGLIVIVDGWRKDIREYVERRYGDRVKFVRQNVLNGPAQAIRLGMNQYDLDDSVVVWLGDAIILDEEVPFGTDFLMTTEPTDQSLWCIWDGAVGYHNKPRVPVEGKALVGLYSFDDASVAKRAFANEDAYEISDGLRTYSEMRGSAFADLPAQQWYDIGEPRTYHETKARLLNRKARAFNTFSYDHEFGLLTKAPRLSDRRTTDSVETIEAEKAWYSSLSREQGMFVPRTFPNESGITMTLSPGVLLSDVLLYDDVPVSTWRYIVGKLVHVMGTYFHSEPPTLVDLKNFERDRDAMWIDKTAHRLSKTSLSVAVKDGLMGWASTVAQAARPVGAVHGDLHLGNVMYDPQTDRITLLDPRGRYGDRVTKAGDDHYDWCKLAHDMYFGYYSLVANSQFNTMSKEVFMEVAPRERINNILKGGLLLLATAIPLHYEDRMRQQRMMQVVMDNFELMMGK